MKITEVNHKMVKTVKNANQSIRVWWTWFSDYVNQLEPHSSIILSELKQVPTR